MKKLLLLLCAALFVTAAFAGDPKIDSVNYTPAPAVPGNYFNLYVYVKNDSGTESKNLEFSLDLTGASERSTDYPFSLGSDESKKKTVASILPSRTALIQYTILVDPNASDGEYTLLFKFKDGLIEKEQKQKIKVLSRRPDIEVISSSETIAAPGQVLNLNLGVKNVGNGIAMDVLAGVEGERTVTSTGIVVEREYSALGSSFALLKDLEPGKETSASISLAINPNAEQKNYSVPIKLKYKDTNGNAYTKTTYIGIKVTQEPLLDSTISEVKPKAFPGGTSEITFDLFNIGIGTAKYVVAEIQTEAGTFDQSKVFIGTLEADDFDSFKVDLAVSPGIDAEKNQKIKLVLSYKNQYGEDKSVSKELGIDILSVAELQAQAGSGNPLLAIFGLIALVLELIGLYVVAKKAYKRLVKKK